MEPYSEFQPTGLDRKGLLSTGRLAEYANWLVAPCACNRDSALHVESNWEEQLKKLQAVSEQGEDWEGFEFGHWGCGWFRIVLVRPGSSAARECEQIEASLENYPLLDEDEYSSFKFEAMCKAWEGCSLRERVRLLSKYGGHIMAARRDELPECIDAEALIEP